MGPGEREGGHAPRVVGAGCTRDEPVLSEVEHMIGRMEQQPSVGRASGPLGAVQAADREIARQTAVRARALAAFAAARPGSVEGRWWAEVVEARALRGEWRGKDDPPLEELQWWWWDEEAAWPVGTP